MKKQQFIPVIFLSIAINLFSITANSQSCQELIWEDQFEGSSVDQTKWNIEVNAKGGGNAEKQYYTDRPENIKVENGYLTITALKENYLGSEYTSARINSKNKGDWKYGRMEAKIKLPKGQGIWPAFWMLSTEEKFGEWPASGEIDIMENIGSKPDQIIGTLHYGPVWTFKNDTAFLADPDIFHTYSVQWTPDSIEWFVDNVSFSILRSEDIVDENNVSRWYQFQEKFYMILNLAVGGNWPGDPDGTTKFPQELVVDYVKVYGIAADQEISALNPAYANAKNVQYSLTDIPGATYNWSVPSEASIVAGQGTHLISVDWGCTTGNVSVEIQSSCGTNTISKAITFDTPFITGDTTVYQDQKAVVFSVPDMNNTTYTWTFPAGTIIQSGDGTHEISVNWPCSAGNVNVVIENSCATSNPQLKVNLLTPSIKGPLKVSESSVGVEYFIDSIPGYTYFWTVPNDAAIPSGQNTHLIHVDFGISSGEIKASLTNTCGTLDYTLNIVLTDTILLCNHESTVLNFLGWSGSTFEIVDNHQQNSYNNSTKIGKGFKTSSKWSGIYAQLNYSLDITRHKSFSVKILGPKTGNVLFKLEKYINNATVDSKEVLAPYTTAGEWQELKFDFSSVIFEGINRITIFYDFNVATQNYFYFDDINFLPVVSTSINSPEKNSNKIAVFPVPAKERIFIDILDGDLKMSNYRLISVSGKVLINNKFNGKFTNEIDISSIQPGMYFLEIQSENEKFIRKVIVE